MDKLKRLILTAGRADSARPAASIQDKGVDHRRLHAPVAQQLLDRADVVTEHDSVEQEQDRLRLGFVRPE
jgi:hypothetical protein